MRTRPILKLTTLFLLISQGLVAQQPPDAPAASAPATTPAATQPLANPNVVPQQQTIGKGQEEVPGQPGVVQDKHAFGVLPNYRTAEGSVAYAPITVRQKFTIANSDTLDGPSFALAAIFSGISQLNNTDPSFGQGVKGYAHRYATGLADQILGNYMTEAIMPTVFHQDPRYFRKGTGSIKSRVWWAATRSVVARDNSGRWDFNYSEFIGNGIVGSIGNLYYPDERGFSPTMQRMFTQIGTDTFSQVLKEFWPDVKKKWFHGKDNGNVPVTAELKPAAAGTK